MHDRKILDAQTVARANVRNAQSIERRCRKRQGGNAHDRRIVIHIVGKRGCDNRYVVTACRKATAQGIDTGNDTVDDRSVGLGEKSDAQGGHDRTIGR